jgi:lysozyme
MDMQKLRDQLSRHEGLSLKPYLDTVGKWTIGIGHNLSDKGISEKIAFSLLDEDIQDAFDYIDHNFSWFPALDEVRQRVIADMVFNLGPKIKQFKTMLAAIEAKDWKRASESMLNSLWARQVGQRALTLAKMMETGQD